MTPMDDCPIIWRNFSRAGYVTAYVEDEPTIGTFNYKKAGFKHAPTDFYLRPFLLAAQDHMQVAFYAVLLYEQARARPFVKPHCQLRLTALATRFERTWIQLGLRRRRGPLLF